MALETLHGAVEIGGFKVTRGKPADMTWPEYDATRSEFPIHISDTINTISFKIQEGPIKEVGTNGCQVDTILYAAKAIIDGLNTKFPCRENSMAITKIDEALLWLWKRTKDREVRGVEGTSKV